MKNIDSTRKVSIITPVYNGKKYIEETMKSVQNQTYTNWEMLIIDDKSTDNTRDIVIQAKGDDDRIKLISLEKNGGVANARNEGVKQATGDFIAYLDADDLWYPDKLEKQVAFMNDNNYAFSCVSYEVIDENSEKCGKKVYMKDKLSYKGYLMNNLLQTVGIMVDITKVPRERLKMPPISRTEDTTAWLSVLKTGNDCYGIKEILAQYRRAGGSLSGNKGEGAKSIWELYRKREKLPFFFSCYCFVRYAILAVWKRSYKESDK